ncbi:unnamed protein product [Paramecium octaurelia]|uniref:Secreted protein n=1 Tax=Paramecium octaurelia TaxID=43137 RepID=A0A8S1YGI5_PAROT|nr:unnamed protein product [Paramecium octaurelia]
MRMNIRFWTFANSFLCIASIGQVKGSSVANTCINLHPVVLQLFWIFELHNYQIQAQIFSSHNATLIVLVLQINDSKDLEKYCLQNKLSMNDLWKLSDKNGQQMFSLH